MIYFRFFLLLLL